MPVKKETSVEHLDKFCANCRRITRHEGKIAKLFAGLPKTLRKKNVIETKCTECGRIER